MWMVHGSEPLLVRVRRSVRRRRPSAAAGAARDVAAAPDVVQDGPWAEVVDHIPQVIVVVDGAGRVVGANAAARRLLFGPREAGDERSLLDFVDPLDRQKAATAPLARRVGWQIRLDTPGARRTFAFDCIPLASATGARSP